MDVILRQDVEKLGRAGELVTVKDGFARNYLLPRGLAYQATEGNRRRLEAEKRQHERRASSLRESAQETARRLEQVQLTFTMKAGDGERLFGSVTSGDIAEQLAAQGFEIDKKSIELHEPLKTIGVYKIPVKLHHEVKPEIRVWVVKE